MKKYIDTVKNLALSATAKDTFILFAGNVASAFWGFLFTLFVARSLSISDFGIFSAALNLVIIVSSIADIGISTGSVNFVAESYAKGDAKAANEFIKASFLIRTALVLFISAAVIIFAPVISPKLLASNNSANAVWAGAISIFYFFDLFFPYILQAKRKFVESVIYDNAYYIGRLGMALVFFFGGILTITNAYLSFFGGFLLTFILTFVFVKFNFLFSRPKVAEYKKLLKFSGWIGINRIISSISGRLDIQMLAAIAGAEVTGLYSIPSRLASFIVVLAGSYSSVLATRLAGFADREKEKAYIVKSTLALLPITLGIIFWIIVARPFITILFGQKYLAAVPVFQALAASQIPFLFTVPPVTAIIYSMKKTIYIGVLAFFQLAAIFALNYYFIPKYGPFGPTLTFGITNIALAIYVWWLTIRYYRK